MLPKMLALAKIPQGDETTRELRRAAPTSSRDHRVNRAVTALAYLLLLPKWRLLGANVFISRDLQLKPATSSIELLQTHQSGPFD